MFELYTRIFYQRLIWNWTSSPMFGDRDSYLTSSTCAIYRKTLHISCNNVGIAQKMQFPTFFRYILYGWSYLLMKIFANHRLRYKHQHSIHRILDMTHALPEKNIVHSPAGIEVNYALPWSFSTNHTGYVTFTHK